MAGSDRLGGSFPLERERAFLSRNSLEGSSLVVLQLVCVEIHPAVASRQSARGSSHTVAMVTAVGLFLAILSRQHHGQAPPST